MRKVHKEKKKESRNLEKIRKGSVFLLLLNQFDGAGVVHKVVSIVLKRACLVWDRKFLINFEGDATMSKILEPTSFSKAFATPGLTIPLLLNSARFANKSS